MADDKEFCNTTELKLTNSCMPIGVCMPSIIDMFQVQLLFGTVNCVIFAMGVGGNGYILYRLIKKAHCFSTGVRVIFMTNLTIANLLVALTCLPVTTIQMYTRKWIFGPVACRLVPGLQGISTFAISLTLAGIALDRLWIARSGVDVMPGHYSGTNVVKEWFTVLAMWLVSGLCSIPYVKFIRVINPRIICGVFCEEQWPSPEYKKWYGIGVFVGQFLLPLVVCLYCYTKVYVQVQVQSKRRAVNERLSQQSLGRMKARKGRLARMTVMMLTTFIVSWLPVNVLNLSRDISPEKLVRDRNTFILLFAAAHTIAMSSIIWNPIIYTLCNSRFRSMINVSFSSFEGLNSSISRKLGSSRRPRQSMTSMQAMTALMTTVGDFRHYVSKIPASTQRPKQVNFYLVTDLNSLSGTSEGNGC